MATREKETHHERDFAKVVNAFADALPAPEKELPVGEFPEFNNSIQTFMKLCTQGTSDDSSQGIGIRYAAQKFLSKALPIYIESSLSDFITRSIRSEWPNFSTFLNDKKPVKIISKIALPFDSFICGIEHNNSLLHILRKDEGGHLVYKPIFSLGFKSNIDHLRVFTHACISHCENSIPIIEDTKLIYGEYCRTYSQFFEYSFIQKLSELLLENIIYKQKTWTPKFHRQQRIKGRLIYTPVPSIVRFSMPREIEVKEPDPHTHRRFEFQFEVMGHWRRVKGIGKDQDGNYSVSGKTWVTSHIRGPEDKPIKKQIRKLDLGDLRLLKSSKFDSYRGSDASREN